MSVSMENTWIASVVVLIAVAGLLVSMEDNPDNTSNDRLILLEIHKSPHNSVIVRDRTTGRIYATNDYFFIEINQLNLVIEKDSK